MNATATGNLNAPHEDAAQSVPAARPACAAFHRPERARAQRAEGVAVELTEEIPPKGAWDPPDELLRKLTAKHLAMARNCGPQTTREIIAWAGARGVHIEPLPRTGNSLSADVGRVGGQCVERKIDQGRNHRGTGKIDPAKERPHPGRVPDHPVEDPDFQVRIAACASLHRTVENTGADGPAAPRLIASSPAADRTVAAGKRACLSRTRRPRNQTASPTSPARRRAAPASVDYEALARFRYQLRLFLAFSEAAARRAGLTPQQHQALLAIKGFAGPAPASVGDLARFLLIRHHTAVELVNRMAKLGS